MLIKTRGWKITRQYEIADASAYKDEHRQALQRMLDDAHRGEFSVLVVWAVDRLCRQGTEGRFATGCWTSKPVSAMNTATH